jgi:hypothetical protein
MPLFRILRRSIFHIVLAARIILLPYLAIRVVIFVVELMAGNVPLVTEETMMTMRMQPEVVWVEERLLDPYMMLNNGTLQRYYTLRRY